MPITFILAVLFYSLWFISPKSQNLRIYQKDIELWNHNGIANVMDNLEFEYSVTPAKDNTVTKIVHQTKPLAAEKDEIALKNKFFYKQSFFMQSKALEKSKIGSVIWNEENIASIISKAAKETQQDLDTIYESQTYCLNINYRFKN